MKVVAGPSETIVNFSGLHDVQSQIRAVLLVTVKGAPKLAEQKTVSLMATKVASVSVSVRHFICVEIPLILVGLLRFATKARFMPINLISRVGQRVVW